MTTTKATTKFNPNTRPQSKPAKATKPKSEPTPKHATCAEHHSPLGAMFSISLPTNALGEAQNLLELATADLKEAQRDYHAASFLLAEKEQAHCNAISALNATLFTVKSENKVTSLHAQ